MPRDCSLLARSTERTDPVSPSAHDPHALFETVPSQPRLLSGVATFTGIRLILILVFLATLALSRPSWWPPRIFWVIAAAAFGLIIAVLLLLVANDGPDLVLGTLTILLA